ncbi:MAG: endolytic transglycosylase MltG [Flavobacteriaceae bacterium]|nr:endolytic transglycosylase MltG [Flavobacteriaceae bacterium]
MNKKKLFLTIITGTFLIGCVVAINLYSKIFSSNVKSDTTIHITSDSDFATVLELLTPVLENTNSFEWVATKKNYPNTIKSGKYVLTSGMNNNELVNLLRSGNQMVIQLSFNNQDSLEKLAGRIAQQIEPDSITLLTVMKESSFLSKNKFTYRTALGMYIPNSYQFYWNTSAEKFRRKMLDAYKKFWTNDKIAKAKKQKLSIEQVITLASIVQKETQTVSERPKVAGLYLNRYHHKWPLQADPTVIFAIKEKYGQDKVVKRVLLKDLEIDSKYNTYKIQGIPPGPISMPDISSINAVLNPASHDYYYMCADIENFGQHIFARTLAQHNRNAAKYQKWLNKQGVLR